MSILKFKHEMQTPYLRASGVEVRRDPAVDGWSGRTSPLAAERQRGGRSVRRGVQLVVRGRDDRRAVPRPDSGDDKEAREGNERGGGGGCAQLSNGAVDLRRTHDVQQKEHWSVIHPPSRQRLHLSNVHRERRRSVSGRVTADSNAVGSVRDEAVRFVIDAPTHLGSPRYDPY